jgi:hypothetical protein
MYRELTVLVASALGAAAQQGSTVLSNDRLELTIANHGGAMTSLVLKGDPEKLSPFGDPARMGRAVFGHFVCVDGFGPVSEEEKAAGLPGHGEAHTKDWEIVAFGRQGNTNAVRFSLKLPITQETFTRALTMVDGENVVYVESELESWLGFDRPVNWGEHPSLAAPFLEPEKVVVDVSGKRAKTRVHAGRKEALPRTLVSDREFEWPMAPLMAGGVRDIRSAPANPNSLDHTTTLVDPARTLGFVTALNTARGYLVGYVFRRAEFPWVQDWQDYPPDLRMYRGIEFATQPFDVPRREVVSLGSMFGAPVYRWLPAKSKIRARFLMFWVKAPEGMTCVDEVSLESGRLIVEDRHAGKRLTLPASLGM